MNNNDSDWLNKTNTLLKHKMGIYPNRITIFLDIDGVFNSEIYTRKLTEMKKLTSVELPYPYNSFDPVIVDRFNRLYEQVGAYINVVISSSWRVDSNLPEMWKQVGFNFMYDGVTPYNPQGCRGDEIVEFLKSHNMLYSNFVIIDDDMDMGEHNIDYLGGCWYLVDPKFGMTHNFVEEMQVRIARGETDGDMLDMGLVNNFAGYYICSEGRHLGIESLRWLGKEYDPMTDDVNVERLSIYTPRVSSARWMTSMTEKKNDEAK